MQRHYRFQVAPEYQGYTLLEYLNRHLPDFAEATVRKLLYSRSVSVDAVPESAETRLRADAQIAVDVPDEPEYRTRLLPIRVLHEESDFIIIDKPSGVPAIPEKWTRRAHVKNSARRYFEETRSGDFSPRVLFPLDADASGAIVVAADAASLVRLGEAMNSGGVEIAYSVLAAGTMPEQGTVEGRGEGKLEDAGAKKARTSYRLVEAFHDFSWIEARVERGFSRQLRIHLASHGHPVAIDPEYGYRQSIHLSEIKKNYRPKKDQPEKPLLSRLSLHLSSIRIRIGNRDLLVESPLPEDLEVSLKMLRKYRPVKK